MRDQFATVARKWLFSGLLDQWLWCNDQPAILAGTEMRIWNISFFAGVALIIGLQINSSKQSQTEYALLSTQVAANALASKEAENQVALLHEQIDRLYAALHENIYPQRRVWDLLRQMTRSQPFVLFLGDSITENANLPNDICGYPIINAGIGGSRASNLIAFAEDIKAKHPNIVAAVVAVGVNDAQKQYATEFEATYRLMLNSLPKTKIILATPAPVDSTGEAGANINIEKYRAISDVIRSIADERGIQVVDLNNIEGLQTIDGLHLSAGSYAKWETPLLNEIKQQICISASR